MKRYFKAVFEDPGLGSGQWYVEYDGPAASRQAENYDGQWYSSKDETHHEELGMSLSDRPLSEIENDDSLVEISAQEFELAWLAATKH